MSGTKESVVPKIVVDEDRFDLDESDDTYTPPVFRLYPKRVTASIGKEGAGQVRCEIMECEWERKSVRFAIDMDAYPVPGESYTHGFTEGLHGIVSGQDIDRVIAVLTAARREAESLGLFSQRPTPTSIAEVLNA